MKHRSSALAGLCAGALLVSAPPAALAQPGYPTRPIRIIVPTSPPGGADIVARSIAPGLSERLGQQVIVDNRAGASTMLGGELVAKAPPDGYTLMMLAVAQLVATAFDDKLPYDVVRDYAGVSYVSRNPYVMAVPLVLPVRTVREFIDLAKAQPGKLNYGSTGVGGSNHLVTELFNSTAGIKIAHVPYKGPPQALADLAGGQVQLVFASITSGMPLARAGKIRALAVSSLKRSAAAPDVPAIAETLPGYETIGWYGVVAPKATPAALVNRLSTAIARGLQAPEVKERLAADGSEAVGSTPAEFDRHMASEVARFRRVIREAGIRRE